MQARRGGEEEGGDGYVKKVSEQFEQSRAGDRLDRKLTMFVLFRGTDADFADSIIRSSGIVVFTNH